MWVPNLEWQRVQWLSNRTLSYVKNVNGDANIWSYDLDTGVNKAVDQFQSQSDLCLRLVTGLQVIGMSTWDQNR